MDGDSIGGTDEGVRRNVRELVVILGSLLAVPSAAIGGLTVSWSPTRVLAPLFETRGTIFSAEARDAVADRVKLITTSTGRYDASPLRSLAPAAHALTAPVVERHEPERDDRPVPVDDPVGEREVLARYDGAGAGTELAGGHVPTNEADTAEPAAGAPPAAGPSDDAAQGGGGDSGEHAEEPAAAPNSEPDDGSEAGHDDGGAPTGVGEPDTGGAAPDAGAGGGGDGSQDPAAGGPSNGNGQGNGGGQGGGHGHGNVEGDTPGNGGDIPGNGKGQGNAAGNGAGQGNGTAHGGGGGHGGQEVALVPLALLSLARRRRGAPCEE